MRESRWLSISVLCVLLAPPGPSLPACPFLPHISTTAHLAVSHHERAAPHLSELMNAASRFSLTLRFSLTSRFCLTAWVSAAQSATATLLLPRQNQYHTRPTASAPMTTPATIRGREEPALSALSPPPAGDAEGVSGEGGGAGSGEGDAGGEGEGEGEGGEGGTAGGAPSHASPSLGPSCALGGYTPRRARLSIYACRR